MTSIQKKNVEFRQDDYEPSATQLIVKYRAGKGNNLHEVEGPDGAVFLASMPKKFRATIWLKRGDVVVVDPIAEGKKVLGEIVCLLPAESVTSLIRGHKWPLPPPDDIQPLLDFFAQPQDDKKEDSMDLPPSDDDDDEDSEDDENDEEKEEAEIAEKERLRGGGGGEGEGGDTEGFKSRVDFVTSGSVTVTNVTMDVTRLDVGGLQSLDFETEGSSEEEAGGGREKGAKREAHTIRIQVNYEGNNNKAGEDGGGGGAEGPKGV